MCYIFLEDCLKVVVYVQHAKDASINYHTMHIFKPRCIAYWVFYIIARTQYINTHLA